LPEERVPTRRTPRPDEEARDQQTLYLRRSLRKRLRVAAAVLDQEISTLVDEAISRHLDEIDRRRQADGLPPLPT
jgi:hypothetical protein